MRQLLQREPKNPEYRFQYALLLGAHPQLFKSVQIVGVEPNAVTLLNELAEEYPNRPEYGLALVNLLKQKIKYVSRFREADRKAQDFALAFSDRLLGRFPNTPGVVTSIVELRLAYIELVRRSGDLRTARKEAERLQGMLEILFYNPETPNVVKESLLTMQLARLEQYAVRKQTEAFEEFATKIQGELKEYHGAKAKEFQETLRRLSIEKR